jgi:DNA-binding XRE family transcriptional regulator
VKVINFLELFPNAPMAQKMQSVREESGLTISQIYGDTFTRQRVRQSETGAVEPSWALVQALAKGTGWDVVDWLHGHIRPTLPRMSQARVKKMIERYVVLPRKTADVVRDVLTEHEIHNTEDLKRVLNSNPDLARDPLAVWFLTVTLFA